MAHFKIGDLVTIKYDISARNVYEIEGGQYKCIADPVMQKRGGMSARITDMRNGGGARGKWTTYELCVAKFEYWSYAMFEEGRQYEGNT